MEKRKNWKSNTLQRFPSSLKKYIISCWLLSFIHFISLGERGRYLIFSSTWIEVEPRVLKVKESVLFKWFIFNQVKRQLNFLELKDIVKYSKKNPKPSNCSAVVRDLARKLFLHLLNSHLAFVLIALLAVVLKLQSKANSLAGFAKPFPCISMYNCIICLIITHEIWSEVLWLV